MNYRTYILTRQDIFDDEITASYGKPITLRTVRKSITGRGVDTIIIGMPDK